MNRVDTIIDFFLKNRVLKHVVFWLVFFSGSMIYGLGLGEPPMVSFILELIYLPVQILATYVFLYWQLPFLYKKKYWLFGILFIALAYAFATIAHVNYDYGFGTRLISWHKPHSWGELLTHAEFFFRFFVDIYIVVLMATAIKLVVEYFESKRTIEDLQGAKMKSEYILIQSQLQPEFLLRSLKYIERQSIVDINTVPPHIADLSDILDHTLYGSRKETISLSLAVEKLKTYLDLNAAGNERLNNVRLLNTCDVNHHIVPLCLMKISEAVISRFKVTIDQLELILNDGPDHVTVKYFVKSVIEDGLCHIVTKSVTDVLDLMYPDRYSIIEEETNILTIRISL